MNLPKKIKKRLYSLPSTFKEFLKDARTVNNDKATGMIDYEIRELENIFSLLIFGSFVGMPSPPAHITLQLLPCMEKELLTMLEKVQTAHDPLGELAEVLGEF